MLELRFGKIGPIGPDQSPPAPHGLALSGAGDLVETPPPRRNENSSRFLPGIAIGLNIKGFVEEHHEQTHGHLLGPPCWAVAYGRTGCLILQNGPGHLGYRRNHQHPTLQLAGGPYPTATTTTSIAPLRRPLQLL